MIEIAVVEDNIVDREKISDCLSHFSQSQGIEYLLTNFDSGMSFLNHYHDYHDDFDIIFMDIDMPGINGLETARELRSLGSSAILIFVTNMTQYAISGYEVEAMDFIVKPINKYSFAMKMKRAVARMIKKDDEYIMIKTRWETHRIRISSIKYLEMVDHHIVYHTTEGEYKENSTMREAYAKINHDYFVFCNRCYLVNLKYVSSVSKNIVTVDGDELIISRPQKKAFLIALSDFMRGKK